MSGRTPTNWSAIWWRRGLQIDHRRHAALDLLAFELLMDGFSRSKVIRVLTTSMT